MYHRFTTILSVPITLGALAGALGAALSTVALEGR